jgi:hypothetical protein
MIIISQSILRDTSFPRFYIASDELGIPFFYFNQQKAILQFLTIPVLDTGGEDTEREHSILKGEVHTIAKLCRLLYLSPCCPARDRLEFPRELVIVEEVDFWR